MGSTTASANLKTTKMVFGGRRCYVCDAVNVEQKSFAQHMTNHEEELKAFKFSDNTADNCKTTCKVCGDVFPLTTMRNHTKAKHSMPITEYKAKFQQQFFDILEVVFHRCGVCSLPIILDSDSLASHLNSNRATHRLSHREYNDSFLNKSSITNPTSTSSPTSPSNPTSTSIPISTSISLKRLADSPLASLEKRPFTFKVSSTVTAVAEIPQETAASGEALSRFIRWLAVDGGSQTTCSEALRSLEVLEAASSFCT